MMEQVKKFKTCRLLGSKRNEAIHNESLVEKNTASTAVGQQASVPQAMGVPSSDSSRDMTKVEVGGICFDVDEECWSGCYELEETGHIKHWDTDYDYTPLHDHSPGPIRLKEQRFHKAAEPHPSQPDLSWEEVEDIIGKASKAVGRLELRHCEPTTMSGFILNEEFFLSSSHFRTDSLSRIEMRKPGSQLAFVNTDRDASHHYRVVEGKYGQHVRELGGRAGRPVHLILLDQDKNIALYRFDAMEKERKRAASMDFNTHADAGLMDEVNELASRRVFAIGYNAPVNPRAYHESMNSLREKILSQVPEKKYKRLVYPERVEMSTIKFIDIFKPDRKCLTIGRLDNEPLVESRVNYWQHTVSGWAGLAGAMIACMDNAEGTPRLRILGLFYGGDPTQPYNEMSAFDAETLQIIAAAISPFNGD